MTERYTGGEISDTSSGDDGPDLESTYPGAKEWMKVKAGFEREGSDDGYGEGGVTTSGDDLEVGKIVNSLRKEQADEYSEEDFESEGELDEENIMSSLRKEQIRKGGVRSGSPHRATKVAFTEGGDGAKAHSEDEEKTGVSGMAYRKMSLKQLRKLARQRKAVEHKPRKTAAQEWEEFKERNPTKADLIELLARPNRSKVNNYRKEKAKLREKDPAEITEYHKKVQRKERKVLMEKTRLKKLEDTKDLFGKVGEYMECRFEPEMNPKSRRIFKEAHGYGDGVEPMDVIERMENAQKLKERKLKETIKKIEVMAMGPGVQRSYSAGAVGKIAEGDRPPFNERMMRLQKEKEWKLAEAQRLLAENAWKNAKERDPHVYESKQKARKSEALESKYHVRFWNLEPNKAIREEQSFRSRPEGALIPPELRDGLQAAFESFNTNSTWDNTQYREVMRDGKVVSEEREFKFEIFERNYAGCVTYPNKHDAARAYRAMNGVTAVGTFEFTQPKGGGTNCLYCSVGNPEHLFLSRMQRDIKLQKKKLEQLAKSVKRKDPTRNECTFKPKLTETGRKYRPKRPFLKRMDDDIQEKTKRSREPYELKYIRQLRDQRQRDESVERARRARERTLLEIKRKNDANMLRANPQFFEGTFMYGMNKDMATFRSPEVAGAEKSSGSSIGRKGRRRRTKSHSPSGRRGQSGPSRSPSTGRSTSRSQSRSRSRSRSASAGRVKKSKAPSLGGFTARV